MYRLPVTSPHSYLQWHTTVVLCCPCTRQCESSSVVAWWAMYLLPSGGGQRIDASASAALLLLLLLVDPGWLGVFAAREPSPAFSPLPRCCCLLLLAVALLPLCVVSCWGWRQFSPKSVCFYALHGRGYRCLPQWCLCDHSHPTSIEPGRIFALCCAQLQVYSGSSGLRQAAACIPPTPSPHLSSLPSRQPSPTTSPTHYSGMPEGCGARSALQLRSAVLQVAGHTEPEGE